MSALVSALRAAGCSSALYVARRLVSTSTPTAAEAGLSLEQLLQRAPWMQLVQVPGMGRGLFAAEDIEAGTVVWEERPMLAAPSPHSLHTTCAACLRPLLPDGSGAAASSSAGEGSGGSNASNAAASSSRSSSRTTLRFCSEGCRTAAGATWASAAAAANLGPLQEACREAGEKFPLMAAQLACLQVQRQQAASSSSDGSGSSSSDGSSSSGTAAAHAAGDAAPSGDPLTQLQHLCFANIPQPPGPWVHLHTLLQRGLRPLAARSCSAEWLESELSVEWFVQVLARLHLNAFRVDTVPPLDPSDPSALLRAAAASLGGGTLHDPPTAATSHQTGSAVYLLSSMLNHSCEPCLDVSFPRNDGGVRFTAARDIAAHEQLTVSYIDAEQGTAGRQRQLEWAYGFTCRCPRCRDGA